MDFELYKKATTSCTHEMVAFQDYFHRIVHLFRRIKKQPLKREAATF
jgi:hypothetical protein